MKPTDKIVYTPAPYVVKNIKEMVNVSTNTLRPGMFVYMKYLRQDPNYPDDPRKRKLVTRVVFVLKKLWEEKMHLLDVSQFKPHEWKMFYRFYLEETDPELFAEKLINDKPTVVDEISKPKTFYHGTLKIPLKKMTEVAYRTYRVEHIKMMKQIFYESGNKPIIEQREIDEIIRIYEPKGYST